MKTTKNQVEHQLKYCNDCRNDDVHLTTHLWKTNYPKMIKFNAVGVEYVYLKDIELLPREDHIKRVRATFQNDKNQYLPDNDQVRKARGINEDRWKEFLGYKTVDKNQEAISWR